LDKWGIFMEKIDGKIYLKQAELAKRWRCSEGSIINYRKKLRILGLITII